MERAEEAPHGGDAAAAGASGVSLLRQGALLMEIAFEVQQGRVAMRGQGTGAGVPTMDDRA